MATNVTLAPLLISSDAHECLKSWILITFNPASVASLVLLRYILESAIGLAGVMGGLTTEVENFTKDIIIESAIFDGVKVRKTSKKFVRSEASNRFEKGLDPNRTYMAIERACHLLEKYADATIVSGICVYDRTDKQDKEIKITVENINSVLGTELTEDEVIDVFKRLKFKGYAEDGNISVLVPRRRLDISIKEDLIEEVGRIYGVDNIKGKLPVLPMKAGSFDRTTREIRNKMVSLGLNETLTYVLVNEEEAKQYTTDVFQSLKLLDPLTEERSTLRYSVIPSLVKTYEYNKARNIKDVSIFEIGKGFFKKGEEYGENNKLCVLMAGEYYEGLGNKQNVDFYIIKGIAEEILDYLGYAGRYSFVRSNNLPEQFHPGQSAEINVNNDIVGVVAKSHPQVSKDDVYVLGFPFGISEGEGFPIWKRASIASEPIIDIQDRPLMYIDTASRSGMSGSPVIYKERRGVAICDTHPTKATKISHFFMEFIGVYSGRIGADDEFKAQLGRVWKKRVIDEIINR